MRTKVLIGLLVLPALAGCLGSTAPAGSASLDATADPVEQLRDLLRADHDHTDPTLHNDSHAIDAVGYSPLIGDEDQTGAYTEVDYHDGHVVMPSKIPVGGFVIADVTDPTSPEVVSWYKASDMYTPDAKWGPDGNWIFLASHGFNAQVPNLGTDHEGPIPYGVHAVDVSDKQDPKLSSYMQCGTSGVHNVHVADIGGTVYVFGACYDSFLNRVVIGRFDPTSGQLVRVNEFSLGNLVEGNLGSVHDMVIDEDPVEGTPVLTVSYGGQGAVWVDVSDPMDPSVLGQWRWEGSDHVVDDHPRFLHYAELYEKTVDGQRVAVAAPEYSSHGHTGQVWIINVTDWNTPTLYSAWEGVANVSYSASDEDPASVYRYSPHNFILHEGTFYIAHNHAGLWAVDFASSRERLTDPKPLGFFAASHDPGHDVPIDNAPDYWGVDVDEEGNLYVSDRGTGLYVLHPAFGHGHHH